MRKPIGLAMAADAAYSTERLIESRKKKKKSNKKK
jgi:hypothetical protein